MQGFVWNRPRMIYPVMTTCERSPGRKRMRNRFVRSIRVSPATKAVERAITATLSLMGMESRNFTRLSCAVEMQVV